MQKHWGFFTMRIYQKVIKKCTKRWYIPLVVKVKVKIHHVVQIMPSIKLEETATTSQKLRVY